MTDQTNSQSSGEGQGQQAPSADNATATSPVMPLAAELGPNGLPIHPPAGDEGESVEADFLMNTFFGDGQAPAPNTNPSSGQGKGSNEQGGQTQPGSLAPPVPAPAANGGEGSPQPGPSPTPSQQGEQQAPAGGAATQTPPPGPPPAGEQQPPAQQGLSVEDRLRLASVDALSRQNQELIERLRRYESGGQPGQPQPQGQPSAGQPSGEPSTQPAGQNPVEAIRLAVPDALYDQIMSDDPGQSKLALSALITGVAQNAAKTVWDAVPALIDARVSGVLQQLEAGKTVEKMEQAYFDAFPAHNNELLKPLIQQVTNEKYQQFPGADWNADMINAVGATVTERLKALGIDPLQVQPATGGQQSQQGGNGSGQSQPRPQPAPMLDTGNRHGAGGGAPQDAGDFIKNTFM